MRFHLNVMYFFPPLFFCCAVQRVCTCQGQKCLLSGSNIDCNRNHVSTSTNSRAILVQNNTKTVASNKIHCVIFSNSIERKKTQHNNNATTMTTTNIQNLMKFIFFRFHFHYCFVSIFTVDFYIKWLLPNNLHRSTIDLCVIFRFFFNLSFAHCNSRKSKQCSIIVFLKLKKKNHQLSFFCSLLRQSRLDCYTLNQLHK